MENKKQRSFTKSCIGFTFLILFLLGCESHKQQKTRDVITTVVFNGNRYEMEIREVVIGENIYLATNKGGITLKKNDYSNGFKEIKPFFY